jgi:hypothetical protein
VQFGDAYNPNLPYYSGILSSGNERTASYRQYRDLGTQNILLAYCHEENAWTFSDTLESDDTCNYFAKSVSTKTYDVTTIPDSDWQIVDIINRLRPFDSFSLVGRDCDPKICQGTCGDDGLCKCPNDQFGMECEFSNVCAELVTDLRFYAFPYISIGNEMFEASDSFQILRNPLTKEYVKVYNMPAYYSNNTYPANIIFYGGRRWILTTEWDLFNSTKAKEESGFSSNFFLEKTVETLEHGFHGHHDASYTPFFISSPVDFETPDFKPTPEGLDWWTAKSMNRTRRAYVPDLRTESVLRCAPESCIGKPNDYCGGLKGECDEETGQCRCFAGLNYRGERCEIEAACYQQETGATCYGNGICDESTGFCDCKLP